MRRRGSIRTRGAAALFVLTALSLAPVGSASGSCAGPDLQVRGGGPEPATVRVDMVVIVDGTRFVDGCDDTGGGNTGFGCSSSDDRETETAMEEVTLTLRQGQRQWDLGTQDAVAEPEEHRGEISWKVTIPDDVGPGPATLTAGDATEDILVGPFVR
jgi:hypothetical protein